MMLVFPIGKCNDVLFCVPGFGLEQSWDVLDAMGLPASLWD